MLHHLALCRMFVVLGFVIAQGLRQDMMKGDKVWLEFNASSAPQTCCASYAIDEEDKCGACYFFHEPGNLCSSSQLSCRSCDGWWCGPQPGPSEPDLPPAVARVEWARSRTGCGEILEGSTDEEQTRRAAAIEGLAAFYFVSRYLGSLSKGLDETARRL
eukprot:TRINITY_DN56132_c0_g1_i1.p1 TRINITY_DN56132_c0_g1~~TRINITY_DN56132_c0_g1_i1.p1  ORF type:complete len:159 (+),score=25.43 TRINITY_DN56132_c0_g1_i1:48-524(+)